MKNVRNIKYFTHNIVITKDGEIIKKTEPTYGDLKEVERIKLRTIENEDSSYADLCENYQIAFEDFVKSGRYIND